MERQLSEKPGLATRVQENEYGIRLYSRVGAKQEWMQKTDVIATHHGNWINHGNWNNQPTTNLLRELVQPDTKVSRCINVRDDGDFGFIANLKNETIYTAPSKTVGLLKGLMNKTVAEVRILHPNLLELVAV